jgi:hypothetical protein
MNFQYPKFWARERFTIRDLGERANAARCDIVDPGTRLGYGERNGRVIRPAACSAFHGYVLQAEPPKPPKRWEFLRKGDPDSGGSGVPGWSRCRPTRFARKNGSVESAQINPGCCRHNSRQEQAYCYCEEVLQRSAVGTINDRAGEFTALAVRLATSALDQRSAAGVSNSAQTPLRQCAHNTFFWRPRRATSGVKS